IENARSGQKLTLRDLVLSTIAGGRIGTVTVAGASAKGPTADAADFGPMNATDLDLALAARPFAGAVRAVVSEPRKLVNSLTLDAIDVRSPDTTIKVERIAAKDLRSISGFANHASTTGS